jgi:hypothetical protein
MITADVAATAAAAALTRCRVGDVVLYALLRRRPGRRSHPAQPGHADRGAALRDAAAALSRHSQLLQASRTDAKTGLLSAAT